MHHVYHGYMYHGYMYHGYKYHGYMHTWIHGYVHHGYIHHGYMLLGYLHHGLDMCILLRWSYIHASWIYASCIHVSWIHSSHESTKGGWGHHFVGHTAWAPEGREGQSQLEVGARRAPRLLVFVYFVTVFFPWECMRRVVSLELLESVCGKLLSSQETSVCVQD